MKQDYTDSPEGQYEYQRQQEEEMPTWIDTLFSLASDESITIKTTINKNLSIAVKKYFNRDWNKGSETVFTQEDIKRYGKAYVIEHVTKMLQEVRN